jgi:hypothetical protein
MMVAQLPSDYLILAVAYQLGTSHSMSAPSIPQYEVRLLLWWLNAGAPTDSLLSSHSTPTVLHS